MKKCILIIEDNEDIRENAAELLALEGYEVLMADCGITGIDLANFHKPDLIICDIVMAGMDGYCVYGHLKEKQATKNIPFIFSSAKSQKSDLHKAKEIGVENYLIKPFSDVELFDCVAKCLKQTENHRAPF